MLTVLEYAAYLTAARSLGPTHHAIAVLGGMMGLRASEMAALTVESLTNVRGYVTLTFIGKGDKPARVPVPLPALPAIQDAVAGRSSGPLLRTRTGAGMDRRSVHRYVARTARVAGMTRPIGPHALRRTVGTVRLNQGIPLRDIQRLLRHTRPETTLASYDISGDAPRTTRLAPGRGLPRRLGRLTRLRDAYPAPRCPQGGFSGTPLDNAEAFRRQGPQVMRPFLSPDATYF